MRVSVLLVTIYLRVCSVRAVSVDVEKNQRSPMEDAVHDPTEQQEEGKEIKAENKTTSFKIKLDEKAQGKSTSIIDQFEISNKTIENKTKSSENKTIENKTESSENLNKTDKTDTEGITLANLPAISQIEMAQRNETSAQNFLMDDCVESTTLSFDGSGIHDATRFESRLDDDVTQVHHQTNQNESKYEHSRQRGEYKIRRMTGVRHAQKMIQRRTFDIWSLLGMGGKQEQVIRITKEVPVFVPYKVEKKIPIPVTVQVERKIPVAVPKPYPVPMEKKVYYTVKEYVQAPYPVYKKVPYLVKVMIEKPVPVHVSKPYPIYIEKKVPYAVEKEVPYPVKVPVDRPVPVHIPVVKNIYYPVEKHVPFPIPVPVEQPIPIPVEKPYPVFVNNVDAPTDSVPRAAPIEEPVHVTTHDLVNHNIKQEGFVTSETDKNLDKAPLFENKFIKDNSFESLEIKGSQQNHNQILLDKKDTGDEQEIYQSQDGKNEEKKLDSMTEPTSAAIQSFKLEKREQRHQTEEGAKNETISLSDFGKKVKRTNTR